MSVKKVILATMMAIGSAAALAGQNYTAPVEVTVSGDNSGRALGAMGSARFSANPTEFIGCRRMTVAGAQSEAVILCSARNAAGTTVECFTMDPALIDVVRGGLTDYAFIDFSWLPDGTCSTIIVSTNSRFIPR